MPRYRITALADVTLITSLDVTAATADEAVRIARHQLSITPLCHWSSADSIGTDGADILIDAVLDDAEPGWNAPPRFV